MSWTPPDAVPSAQTIIAFMSGLGVGSILSALVTYHLTRRAKRADARLEADRKLYGRIVALLSPRMIEFMRGLNATFEYEEIRPLKEFDEFRRSPEQRFHDRKVEAQRVGLSEAVNTSLRYIAEETFDTGGGFGGAPPEWKGTDRERHARVVRELGEHADVVIAAHGRFVETARKRLHL